MPKSKRSGPALKVLQTAQTSFQSKLSGLHVNEFSQTTWEDARQGVLDTEARMAARGCLRNTRRLMPLFEGLHHYSKAIEVLCNAVPFMPFVWAPIKFIVNVTCENVKAFDKIIGQYARIGESLVRFKMLQAAFSNYPEFQQIVAVFYSDILEFNGEAYKFVTRSAWELFFLTSWGRFERRFESIMENLKAHEMLLDRTANALNITEARQQREALSLERAENLALVKVEEKLRHANLYQEISTWLKVDDTEQALVFDSITQEVSKYPGTHDWIVQQDKIRPWLKDDSNCGFLWLQGNPGSGKTAIANRIVAFLQKIPDSVVVRHFCDPLTPTSASYDFVLRSLLFQLVRANEDLVAYIHSLKTSQFLQKTVSPEALEDVIKKISGAVPRDLTKNHTIHIIIDGLDVCEQETLKRLVRLLKHLVSSLVASTCFYKILIVSRRTEFLRKLLGKFPNMSLNDEAKNVTDGIEKYARKRFQSMSSQLHELGVDDGRVKELSKQLATKAEGMFLWARLVLNYISSNLIYHGNEIENAIKVLPKELEQFYEKILLQTISNFDRQSVERLTSMLGWIVYANRPLKKIELQSAITFSSGDPEQEDVVPSFVLSLCSQLVEERADSTLVLIHSSVKEYLQSPGALLRISEQDAMKEHGTATMACLLSATRCFGSGEMDGRQQQQIVLSGVHAFQLYAQEHWVDYVLATSFSSTAITDNTLDELMRGLCSRLDNMYQREPEWKREVSKDDMVPGKDPLRHILHLPALYWAGATNLRARSQGPRDVADHLRAPGSGSPLGKVLSQYQGIVRELLSEEHLPGIGLDKLASFRETHRDFAYTCRLGGCRRQAAGFETEKLRDQHEEEHRSFLRCVTVGCQYPPFPSAKALQRHVKELHTEKRQYRSIRRKEKTLVGSRPTFTSTQNPKPIENPLPPVERLAGPVQTHSAARRLEPSLPEPSTIDLPGFNREKPNSGWLISGLMLSGWERAQITDDIGNWSREAGPERPKTPLWPPYTLDSDWESALLSGVPDLSQPMHPTHRQPRTGSSSPRLFNSGLSGSPPPLNLSVSEPAPGNGRHVEQSRSQQKRGWMPDEIHEKGQYDLSFNTGSPSPSFLQQPAVFPSSQTPSFVESQNIDIHQLGLDPRILPSVDEALPDLRFKSQEYRPPLVKTQAATPTSHSMPSSTTPQRDFSLTASPSTPPILASRTALPPRKGLPTSQTRVVQNWSAEELEVFPYLLTSFGSDWTAMAAHLETKSAVLLKRFYENRPEYARFHWESLITDADERKRKGLKLPDPPVHRAM